MFFHKKSKKFEIEAFFDKLFTFTKALEENGMEEEEVKSSLKPLLTRHFEDSSKIDTTSAKIDRINNQTAKIIDGVEKIKTQVNTNLMNMDVANDIAQKAKDEAEKFDAQAGELASMMSGGNLTMILILVGVGLLLAIAVFANLYSTIYHTPTKNRKLSWQVSPIKARFEQEEKKQILSRTSKENEITFIGKPDYFQMRKLMGYV